LLKDGVRSFSELLTIITHHRDVNPFGIDPSLPKYFSLFEAELIVKTIESIGRKIKMI